MNRPFRGKPLSQCSGQKGHERHAPLWHTGACPLCHALRERDEARREATQLRLELAAAKTARAMPHGP